MSFFAQSDRGDQWLMGETIADPVTLQIAWSGCRPGATVVSLRTEWDCTSGRRRRQVTRRGRWQPGQAHWVLLEVRGADGETLAITNPIFWRKL